MNDDAAVPAEAVRAELERVLASKGFQSAGRLSRLLRHVTEKTLAGDADQLKEYTVGVEVFDRDTSYDPRLDAIVRVEAGRLRSRLDEYYANGGVAHEIRIELPRGAYVARFTRRTPPSTTPTPAAVPDVTVRPRRSRAVLSLVAGGIAIVIGLLALWMWRPQPARPAVAVLPFSEYSNGSNAAGVAARLNDDVTSELARLARVDVVSHTSATQFAGARKPLRDIAAALHADFVVEATVTAEENGIKVVARIVDAATDRKMWVQDYHGRADALQDLSREIANDVSTAVLARRPAR